MRVHADVLLATDPNTIFLTGDLREPEELLGRPELRDHLDLSKPVALLLVAVLQFIEDNQQAYDIVKTLCDALPAGSYLVLSHPLKDESVEQALAVLPPRQYRRAVADRGGDPPLLRRPHPRRLRPGPGGGIGLPGRHRPERQRHPPRRPRGVQEMPGMFGIARIDR